MKTTKKEINDMSLSKIKINPVRIRVSKNGHALMLLLEYVSRIQTAVIGKITQFDEYFDVELRMTAPLAQMVKKYINNNL